MDKVILIMWTAKDLDEAKKVAKELVQRKWVACVNIFPEVHSIYLWEGKVEEGKEAKVFLKTTEKQFSLIKDFIAKNTSYEVSEISKLVFDDVHEPYRQYVLNTVSS